MEVQASENISSKFEEVSEVAAIQQVSIVSFDHNGAAPAGEIVRPKVVPRRGASSQARY